MPHGDRPQAAGAQHFAMDAGEDVGEAPAAGRAAPLLEVLLQERVQQRTVEQIVDPAPLVPLLYDVVPQMVEQLVEAPTIVSLVKVIEQPVDIPVRIWGGTGGRLQGFLPGQFSSSSVEQNVDIPVPHGCDRVSGGLLGLHPEQLPSRSLTFQFRVVAEFFILHRRLPVCQVWQIKGFFSHFSPW